MYPDCATPKDDRASSIGADVASDDPVTIGPATSGER